MPLTPAVIEAANAFRARLLQRERQASTALVRYYGTSWTRIHADIMALSREVQAMRAAGEEVTDGKIMRLQRMRAIEAQVERELDRFAEFADGEISARQREAIATGERDAYQLMQLSLPGTQTVAVNMYRMPREAVENYVGMMQDGTPLRDILTKYVGDSAQALSETLVTGMVAGWNPRKVARETRNAYGMALSDAMRLARTEQLRAYRTANLQSYQANSDVVTSWRRMSARLPNSCIACIMLDGKVYTLGEPMDDHPNGKCYMVPVTKTYAELGIDAPEPTFNPGTGREWFERQDEATQRQMMGTGMFDAWKDGRFALEDIPHKIEDATWGNHWTPRSLYDLLGESGPVGSYAEWKGRQGVVIDTSIIPGLDQAQSDAVHSAEARIMEAYSGPARDVRARYIETDEEYVAMWDGRTMNVNGRNFKDSAFIDERVDMLRSTNRRIDRMKARLEESVREFGTDTDEAEYIRSRIARYENNARDIEGRAVWVASESLEDIILHEYGHAIHTDISLGYVPSEAGLWGTSSEIRDTSIPFEESLPQKLTIYARDHGMEISEYATTNEYEYFAESFVRYTQGRTDKIMPELLDLFKRILH